MILLKNKVFKNAAWIIACRIVRALLGFFLTMISARYLGPSGYGTINYAASIVNFVVPVMQLGLNSTLVQEIVERPENEGETIGTALLMTMFSSAVCIAGVVSFAAVTSAGNTESTVICALYSISLIFQAIELIQYWFQAKLLSKYSSIVMLLSYICVSVYKLILLISGTHIYMFALAQAFDFAIISISLLLIYKRIGKGKFSFSLSLAKKMFRRSKHYILSGLMVSVFAQTDRIMLKFMLDEAAVGFYSAAITCSSLTSFVFMAIIESFRPSILEKKKSDNKEYENDLAVLYSLIIGISLLQCFFTTLFSELIVVLIYGKEYIATIGALRISVWHTLFSYLGSVRNIWVLAEGKQNYLWIINLSGAVLNIILNVFTIPEFGIEGAAISTLITQFFTNVVMGWVFKPFKHNNTIMLKGLNFRLVLSYFKK